MAEQNQLDFLLALGQEICESLSEIVGADNISPQDGYEVFVRAFRRQPTPQLLTSLSDADVEMLRVASEDYFEVQPITLEQIREAVSHTLRRFPTNE